MGVSVGVSPFAKRSLNETLGFAVGFRGIGLGEALLEAEIGDGATHGVGAIAGAVVGVDPLGRDAEPAKESESGMEKENRASSGLIWEELSEGEAGMIVDGDVKELPAGAARVIPLAIAGDAMTGALDAGEFLDVEVDEFAWMGALVAADWERRRKLSQAWAMEAKETRNGGFGEVGGASDLKAGEATSAQGEHTCDPQRMSSAGRTAWP
jgi:hypothetical protein